MSAYQTDTRIDDYIQTLPDWQQAFCRQVREVIHAADPDVSETIKRSKLPYFTLNGNMCALLAAKDHFNIFIYDPLFPIPMVFSIKDRGTRRRGRFTCIKAKPSTSTPFCASFKPLLLITVRVGDASSKGRP